MDLVLRRTSLKGVEPGKDFVVIHEEKTVGRILVTKRAGGESWFWSITVPKPYGGLRDGVAETREEAMKAFKEAFEVFKEILQSR